MIKSLVLSPREVGMILLIWVVSVPIAIVVVISEG